MFLGRGGTDKIFLSALLGRGALCSPPSIFSIDVGSRANPASIQSHSILLRALQKPERQFLSPRAIPCSSLPERRPSTGETAALRLPEFTLPGTLHGVARGSALSASGTLPIVLEAQVKD